jgi:hypothetical protein
MPLLSAAAGPVWPDRLAVTLGLALYALVTAPGATRGSTTVQILETDPASPAILGRTQPFSLRVGYTTTEPVVIGEEPSFAGRRKPAMNNGEAHRGPGDGEILLWFAYYEAQRVDSVRVTATTPSGKLVAEAALPVDLVWSGRPTLWPAPAIWVERLRQEMEQHRKAEHAVLTNSPFMRVIDWVVVAMMWCVPGYFVLQGWMVWRLYGGWRKAAAAPLWPMGAVLLYTVYALIDGSNIFPLVLIFSAPLAFFYLLIIAGLRCLTRLARAGGDG